MLKKPGLRDRGMASDVRMQTMIEKKNPGLTDSGVAIDVTKTRSVRPRCGQRSC